MIKYTDPYGKKRTGIVKICNWCSTKFIARAYSNNPANFCSRECSYEYRKKRVLVRCLCCNAQFERTKCRVRKANFCDRKCKEKYQSETQHPNWQGGHYTYRQRAFKHYGKKCVSGDKCPLKDIKLPDYMLDVDHIDSDRNNNVLSNLQVMCAWCHREKTWKK